MVIQKVLAALIEQKHLHLKIKVTKSLKSDYNFIDDLENNKTLNTSFHDIKKQSEFRK